MVSSLISTSEKGSDDVTDNGTGPDSHTGPPGSNTSTLTNYTEKDSTGSIASEDNQQSSNEYDIVKKILYGNRENVNIIHEIFRQVRARVFMTPSCPLFSRQKIITTAIIVSVYTISTCLFSRRSCFLSTTLVQLEGSSMFTKIGSR